MDNGSSDGYVYLTPNPPAKRGISKRVLVIAGGVMVVLVMSVLAVFLMIGNRTTIDSNTLGNLTEKWEAFEDVWNNTISGRQLFVWSEDEEGGVTAPSTTGELQQQESAVSIRQSDILYESFNNYLQTFTHIHSGVIRNATIREILDEMLKNNDMIAARINRLEIIVDFMSANGPLSPELQLEWRLEGASPSSIREYREMRAVESFSSLLDSDDGVIREFAETSVAIYGEYTDVIYSVMQACFDGNCEINEVEMENIERQLQNIVARFERHLESFTQNALSAQSEVNRIGELLSSLSDIVYGRTYGEE
ncbi:hypothetical protein FWD07_03020 [Candidatus Saccharibacteria bacterium]|nr:hypothetical protein [Candidatus Saccharibacteria bacterium]